jgi:hypothetical protein
VVAVGFVDRQQDHGGRHYDARSER